MQNSSTSSFRHFAVKTLVPYLLLIGCFAWGLDLLFEQQFIFKDEVSGAAKIKRVLSHQEAELPVLGTSVALRAVIPDSINEACYNYGLEGIGYEVVQYFLIQTLKKPHVKQLMVFLDFDFFKRGIGDPTNYLPFVAEDPMLREMLQSRDNWSPYMRVPGLRYYGNYDIYLRNYLSSFNHPGKTHQRGGAFHTAALSPAMFALKVAQRKARPMTWRADPDWEQALLRLLKQHPDKSLTFVVPPYHHSLLESYQGYDAYWGYVEQLKRLPQVQVIHIDTKSYPDEWFFDTTHLNYQGAQAFSHELRLAWEALISQANHH